MKSHLTKQQIFILAAGKDRPWKAAYPPQLASIGGEPLIVRTLWQCLSVHITVVTDKPVIAEAVEKMADVFDPRPANRWLAETTLSTAPLWKAQRIVVLLGDVIFSNEVIAAVLAERSAMRLYAAKKGEMFAFTFDIEQAIFIQKHLKLVVEDALTRKGPGHLWQFYYSICGWRGDDLLRHHWDDRIWCEVDDYTDDLDYIGQLEDFWKRHPWSRE